MDCTLFKCFCWYGVLGVASPMFQEVAVNVFDQGQIVAIAAGFVALLSLSNILGRIFWASSSDYLGRKNTYFIFFALGFLMYVSSPWAGSTGNIPLFALIFCIILTMYGGGFATLPAYLADILERSMWEQSMAAYSLPGLQQAF
jgi:MFS family permease